MNPWQRKRSIKGTIRNISGSSKSPKTRRSSPPSITSSRRSSGRALRYLCSNSNTKLKKMKIITNAIRLTWKVKSSSTSPTKAFQSTMRISSRLSKNKRFHRPTTMNNTQLSSIILTFDLDAEVRIFEFRYLNDQLVKWVAGDEKTPCNKSLNHWGVWKYSRNGINCMSYMSWYGSKW